MAKHSYVCSCGIVFTLSYQKTNPLCSKCRNKRYCKEYGTAHKQELSEKKKVYYIKNKSRIILYTAKWKRDHPELTKLQLQRWYKRRSKLISE